MIVFCLIYISQIQNISTGFQGTSHSLVFANMSSDSPATAIGHLKFDIKLSKIIQNFAEQFYKKLKF